ncbi:MAG: LysR family transcriptional regulator [Bacilli bacterium]|nr:LysR family transcriptional regulator [Bacilli bacterium]
MNNNIDLNLYKTFYIVANSKSFNEAATKLYISQPAITQSIRKLEEQLNVTLFDRKASGIALTKAGEIVYYYSEKIYEMAEANDNLLEELKSLAHQSITIGVPTHIGAFYFVSYLKEFVKKHPEIKIAIINKKSEEMIGMLNKRELDIVIDTDINVRDNNLLETVEILHLDSCFVCSSEYKEVINKKILSADELNDYSLILPGKTTANRQMIDLFFKKKNVTLNPMIEVNSSSISKKIIKEGLGIGWMIKEFVLEELNSKELYEVKVDIDSVLTPVSIAYNKKFVSDAVKEFIKILKSDKKN